MASESQLPYRQGNICVSLEMTAKWIPARKPPISPSLTKNYYLFMQNKANMLDAQMNVNTYITKDYSKNDAFAVQKNKANSKPISLPPMGRFSPLDGYNCTKCANRDFSI
jgi:hypothetical protein